MPVTEPRLWTTTGAEKRAAVQDMFNSIAPSYDLMNSIISARQHHRLRAKAIQSLNLQPGDKVLDICCGTGDFITPARQAVGPDGVVIGLDFSPQMLQIAQVKHHNASRLSVADACQLPVKSGSFDAVTIGWGLRNVPDLSAALQEAARALRPGGRFVSVDMARPRSPLGILSERVVHLAVPILGSCLGKGAAYRYLPKSTLTFATRDELKRAMEAAGFINVSYQDFLLGNICLHLGTKS